MTRPAALVLLVCLQYGATTAHAATLLLLAHRDHPGAFLDRYQASGLPGANGIPD